MPDWKPDLRAIFANLHLEPEREAEIIEELSQHLDDRYQELLSSGTPPDEAERRARGELNDNDLLGLRLRRVERKSPAEPIVAGANQRIHLISDLQQDLRLAARVLRKNPSFFFIAVLTLALGIGGNTAIFSLINALMLRPLPVQNTQQLVLFKITGPMLQGGVGYNFNYPLYEMLRDQNKQFDGIIASSSVGRARLELKNPDGSSTVESLQQQRVTGNFFSVLGIGAVKGRTMLAADDNPTNTQPGAVISYDYWRRRFALDPTVIGREVIVNATPLTIVGVAPDGFFGFEVGSKPDIWAPITVALNPNLKRSQSWWIRVMGRVKPGVSITQAQAEVESIFRQQVEEEGARTTFRSNEQRRNHFERHAALESGAAGYSGMRRDFRQPLFILMSTVGLVLLIACINVANLLLARAASRRKEIGVRLALGANRFRLIRQLLTESTLLSLIGGIVSLPLARVCLALLVNYLPSQARTALDVSLDVRVLGFTLVVSIVTGLLFGLAPAWQASRLSLTDSLKDMSSSRSRLALNKIFVVSQVALSLFLLIGAGLFVRTLRNLRTLDVGMSYENIVQFSLDTGTAYNPQQRTDLYKRVLERLDSLPGERSATLLFFSLLSNGGISFNIATPDHTPGPDEDTSCNMMAVGPRFFETMKMPILAGRDFNHQDERPAPPTTTAGEEPRNLANAPVISAVVNQSMARYFFGNQNPVGKRFLQTSGQQYEIIGVTQDAKYMNLREQPPRTFYLYYFQLPRRDGVTFQMRTDNSWADYSTTIQRLASELDPQVQVVGLQTMADVVDQSLLQERFIAQTASAFSVTALLLACIGLYGVMSYAVTRRANEIAIRMALGAQMGDVIGLIMREVMLLVLLGSAIGLAGALATTRLVSDLLFGLTPNDPVTIALATLLLLAVAALAGYLPARRAARVDPLTALRWE